MKKILVSTLILVVSLLIVGCVNSSEKTKLAQEEIIEKFLSDFYYYEYIDLDESNPEEACENILGRIKPYLSSNTSITGDTIYNLVINPAHYSVVNVKYSGYSINEESTHDLDGEEVISFKISVDVNLTTFGIVETKTTKQDIAINLIKENKEWKVYGLDYMADDYLFEG